MDIHIIYMDIWLDASAVLPQPFEWTDAQPYSITSSARARKAGATVPSLFSTHQPAVANHIGCENGGEPSLHPLFVHASLVPIILIDGVCERFKIAYQDDKARLDQTIRLA